MRSPHITISLSIPYRAGEGPSQHPWKNILVHSTFFPSACALLSWSPVPMCHPWLASRRCPVVPLCRADPHLAPALWHPTSLRSRRLALGTHTGLLTQPKVQTRSGDFGWVLQYSKDIIRGGLCVFAYNLQITVYFNLLPHLTLHYIFEDTLYLQAMV